MQVRAATVGYVAAGAPSLSVVLVSDMMHDDATVQYLLKQSLLARQAELDRRERRVEEEEKKAKEKEEEKELEQARRELRTLLAVPAPRRTAEQETRVRACRSVLGAAYKRKRKKRRKKKTPRASSHPSLRRAHRRQRQRYVLAGFAGYDTPRAVFPSIVNARGDSTGAVLGQGDMPVVFLSGGFGQTVQKTADSPQLRSIAGRRHPLRAANADPHGSVGSADHGDSPVAAVEKPLALPQLQLVEKSVIFYVPSYSVVTCSVFAFEVQDSGLFWVMTSGNVPVFSAYWFNTGYMSASGGFGRFFFFVKVELFTLVFQRNAWFDSGYILGVVTCIRLALPVTMLCALFSFFWFEGP